MITRDESRLCLGSNGVERGEGKRSEEDDSEEDGEEIDEE